MKNPIQMLVLATPLVFAATVLSACNKPQEVAVSPAPKTTVVADIKDVDVTMGVNSALMLDPTVKSLTIAVETIKGDVRMTGVADNQAQIDQAIKLARGVPGVHAIHNELSIKK